MEKYDVVIIGGGLGSLTTATYLSKRLRNVAVFEEGKRKKITKYSKRFKDSNNSKFDFTFYNYDLGGVHDGDLFNEYLKQCGLSNAFEYYDNTCTMIVGKDKQITRRPNDFKNFKIYLVRHYPKQRNNIHKLFDDIMSHYQDYRIQKQARLVNDQYTLTSALIEWGDLSLYDVLTKYFDNVDLIEQFTLVYDSVGLSSKEINAYNYFVKWFDTFIDGSHFITSSYDAIVKTLSGEISKTREKIYNNRQVTEFVIEDGVIKKIIDDKGNEIYAKHFVINMRIDDFVDQYLPENVEIKDNFYEMYPAAKLERYINQVYIGLNKSAKDVGIVEKQYLFSEIPDDDIRLLSIINYKAYNSKSCANGKSAILVEFLDDNTPRKTKLDQVVSQFVKYFPNAEEHITLSRIGTKRPYFGSLATEKYWENKTINELFSIDDYSELNPIRNAYFIGAWMKPESGITGIIQTGVEYGDIIDDLIYHGDDDDYFINHDELMNIINHQFIPNSLGKEEKNVQFFVGKDSYYIRTKGAHQRLYKGVSDISDIIIIATNECLYDLSVGNTTINKAVSSGTLEFVGEREFLESVMEAFDMGIEITKPVTYEHVPGKRGMQLFILQLSIILLSNLLSNYHYYLIIAPSTLLLFGATVYLKYRIFKKISAFEYAVLGLYFIIGIVSIFIPELNGLKDAKYTLIIFTMYLLVTWLINFPVALNYIRHDYRTDYTRTKLFKKMSGGLTFIWGVTFLVITVTDFMFIRSYASLSYYLIALALYLSFYYPSSYIKGYID